MPKIKSKTKPLPKSVEYYVNKCVSFNMFGFLNLSALRAMTKTRLSNEELKKRITKRFASEMVGNIIEFK